LLNLYLYRTANKQIASVDGEDVVRWASTSKPTVGGISFFATFILSTIVYFFSAGLPGAESGGNGFFALILVVTLGFFIGVQDDTYNTRPLLKFLGQVTCGVIMIMYDVHINLFGIEMLDYFLTIFWVVGIMNSINLLDNMDAVTGTISLVIVSVAITSILIFPGGAQGHLTHPYLFALVACAGAFIGFLALNWIPEALIYMGDTGSQFLGALLAFVGIYFFWDGNWYLNEGQESNMVIQVLVPVMVFVVAIMDTTFVTIGRILRGQSPFVGGKDHLTHNMTYVGVQQYMVPVVLGLISLTSGLLAILSLKFFAADHLTLLTFAFAGYLAVMVLVFVYIYRRGARIGVAKQRKPRTFKRAIEERRNANSSPSRTKEKQHF
jgi:UDP-GlcNAc:undecaprenyl-phosphate GlcNAc-1-phosphate transferase